MRRSVVASCCLVVVFLILAGHPRTPVPVAHAEDTWDVQVGGDDRDSDITTDAYWPSTLAIHAGDTVRWSFWPSAEKHAVTFLHGGASLPFYVPGASPGETAFGPAWFPAGPYGPNIVFDDSQTVSSGAAFGAYPPPFALTFSVAGTFQYVCPLHPGMQGSVKVVSADETLSETPAQAWARGQRAFGDQLGAMRGRIQAPAPDDPDALLGSVQLRGDGTAVRTAKIALSDPGGATALQYFPGDITVRRGDTVAWTNTDRFAEHTVSFTSGQPAPDYPLVQRSGPPVLTLAPGIAGAVGGREFDGRGFVSSGLLQPSDTYSLDIEAPLGTYTYICLIHRDVMHGTITVQ